MRFWAASYRCSTMVASPLPICSAASDAPRSKCAAYHAVASWTPSMPPLGCAEAAGGSDDRGCGAGRASLIRQPFHSGFDGMRIQTIDVPRRRVPGLASIDAKCHHGFSAVTAIAVRFCANRLVSDVRLSLASVCNSVTAPGAYAISAE